MFKSLTTVMTLSLLFVLAGCSSETNETPAQPDPEANQQAMAPEVVTEMETAADTMAETLEDAGQAVEAAAEEMASLIALPDIDKTRPDWKSMVPAPPEMAFAPGVSYFWELETNKGLMRFRLFHEAAPKHVASTIYLTELGFYDAVVFHRVIQGFMAQGGDPTGTGMGGPAYKYAGEFASGLKHDRPGLLSMANAGPGTDGSQFFITFVPTPWLDGKHTIFGELLEGADTLATFEAAGSRSGATSEKLEIIKASITTSS